jgi:3-phosphoshikimate 1-carboxyvinyltransferase
VTQWEAPVAEAPLHAKVALPGSKSVAARELILSLLATGPSQLENLPDGRDTELMLAAIQAFGAVVDGETITPPEKPRGGQRVDCGLSGTVYRFGTAVAALANSPTEFFGDPGLADRPIQPLRDALAQLPAREITIDASASSQFISALLLIGARLPDGLSLTHVGPTLPSLPHIQMTNALLSERGVLVGQVRGQPSWIVPPGPIAGRKTSIEPDLTNTATFLAAALAAGGMVTSRWPLDTVQPAGPLIAVLQAFQAAVTGTSTLSVSSSGEFPGVELDLHDISEFTPVAAALAALATSPSQLRGIGHVRGHETDRLAALAEMLTAVGAKARITADGLAITPGKLRAATVKSHGDHRLVHAAALLGLRVPGIVVDDVAAVTKTIPDFTSRWEVMAHSAH